MSIESTVKANIAARHPTELKKRIDLYINKVFSSIRQLSN
jgi:hypothetical protein